MVIFSVLGVFYEIFSGWFILFLFLMKD